MVLWLLSSLYYLYVRWMFWNRMFCTSTSIYKGDQQPDQAADLPLCKCITMKLSMSSPCFWEALLSLLLQNTPREELFESPHLLMQGLKAVLPYDLDGGTLS